MATILRIKEILKNKGKSLTDLANDMGINRVTLSNMINGNPTLETLNKIAFKLDVEIKDLFYSISKNNYSISKSDFHNCFIYDDEYIQMKGYLPHFTQHDYGTFKLDIKRKDFSIVSDGKLTEEMVYADKSIEEIIYMGEYQDKILIQLFSTYTSLKKEEYLSLCGALRTYSHYHKELKNEIVELLGAERFQRIDIDSKYYILGEVDLETWDKLIELTYTYDLDSSKKDFEKFNATGRAIIMYNLDIKSGYNLKTWIMPLEDKSYENKIVLGWVAPSGHDRNKILSKEIYTARESYNFLFDIMIPKALKIREKKRRNTIFG